MWLQAMKPRYWFAGHLHVHFAAAVPHSAPGNRPGPGSALPSHQVGCSNMADAVCPNYVIWLRSTACCRLGNA